MANDNYEQRFEGIKMLTLISSLSLMVFTKVATFHETLPIFTLIAGHYLGRTRKSDN